MNTAEQNNPLDVFGPDLVNRIAQETIKRHAPDYCLIGFAEMLAEAVGRESVPALLDLVAVAREVARDAA